MLTSVPKCQTVPVDPQNSRLPQNQFDGFGGQADIPKIAIATGSQDPFQCLLLKMGIDSAEFQLPNSGTRRIDYYVDTGMQWSNGMGPPKSSLVGTLSNLMTYDVVILPCGGKPATAASGTYPTDDEFADNVSAYANAGGRVFTTHYGMTWLATPEISMTGAFTASATNPATGNPNPFFGVANWAIDSPAPLPDTTGDVDTALPGPVPFVKGQALSTWLQDIGASTAPGQLPISVARQDMTSVNAPAEEWIHDDASPNEPLFMSFDTPIGSGVGDGGPQACGRVGFADFHVSSTALTSAGGACTTNTDCGFGTTCSPGTQGICAAAECATDSDCGTFGYTCVIPPGAGVDSCIPQLCLAPTDCASGICNSDGNCGCTMAAQATQCKTGVCSDGGECAASAPGSCVRDRDCGSTESCSGANPGVCQKSCTTDADCGPEQCVGGVCQGCGQDSDCVSSNCVNGTPGRCSQSATTFPLGCRQVPMTAQEDALEFMLLDLTSCITTAPPVTNTPPTYKPATFTEDFTSTCPVGTRPVWRELDWQASIPMSAEIDFSAQTADAPDDGGLPDYSMVQLVQLATATTSTVLPSYDRVFLDTGTTGAFNIVIPPVLSRGDLRLTVTMKPTADTTAAPTLISWFVKADCVAAE